MISCVRSAPVKVLVVVAVMVGFFLHTSSGGVKPNALSSEEIEEGWILLFDGASLFGWEPVTEVDWKVLDGAIVATQGSKGLLRTRNAFGDYRLKLEFRAKKGTNSGVFLNTESSCSDPGPRGGCYELNIAPPNNAFPTGSLVGRKKLDGAGETEGWRSFDVTVRNGLVKVNLDGEEVLIYRDEHPLKRGFVGLQFNQGGIEFRSIKLKPDGLQAIFNGTDLTGWTVYPGKKSVFSVTEAGELCVRDGPGQIETTIAYGDFILQLKVKCNGRHLNSGVFFRSIPGEFWQGYESQIHNGFENGDRRRPLDFGTGGIYRRQPARLVVADDFKWFHKTVIASGSNIATWVNGYPVCSWTDTRPPHVNPRNGLRTEPGTLIIQGHDPTTDLQFADIRIVELAASK